MTGPIAGSDDIIVFDTHRNTIALDAGVAFDVESVQVSHDGTELVASIETPVTIVSGTPLTNGCSLRAKAPRLPTV